MTVRHAAVRVPASTSNLGAGFDCVGMAVDLWLSASVTSDDAQLGVTIARSGTLTALPCTATEDLLYEGFLAACVRCGVAVPAHLAFEATSDIPVARGLGSSAAALVAGAALADKLLSLGLGVAGVALLVSQIEGHPDNASPATFGGAILGVANDDASSGQACTYAYSVLHVHESLAFIFAIPPLEVTTAAARAVLPAVIPFHDAVQVVQRSAALVQGLATGDAALLARALDDVLHVPYRRALIPGYDAVVEAACAAGAFGATLSGSGSSMVAIARVACAADVGDAMAAAFRTHGLEAAVLVTAGVVGGLSVDANGRAETA